MPRRRPSRVSQVSIKIGDIEKAIPVRDGGRAWILVAGAFVCQMLCAGLVQGMGVTFVELQNYFGATATEVSWVGSCLTFSACAISVVSGALSRQFGCRPVVICGGLLASVSMMAASFSKELWHLYVFISLTGCGCGLVLPAAISVVGFNFQVHFGIANGLQYAGVGVGIMSIPLLFQLLFEAYSWQGALLIYSSLLLHVCACGILMTPSAAETYSLRKKALNYSSVPTAGTTVNIPEPVGMTLEVKEPAVLSGVQNLDDREKSLPSSINEDDDVFESDLGDSGNANAKLGILRTKEDEANQCSHNRRESSVRFEVDTTNNFKEVSCRVIPVKENITQREKTFHQECVSNVVESMKDAMKIIGVNILWEHPNFLFFALAVMMFGFGYASCLSYFIPRAIQDVGIPQLEASLLLTVLGLCSLIARLTNGLVIDLGLITPLAFFCVSCLVCSISSFFTPFTHSYMGSFVCAGLFGFASGVANPMLAMVSRQIVGQKVMASALGIVLLFNGIGSVAGIFTMGYIYDHFGNYNISFYIAGCDLLLVIVVVCIGKVLTKNLPSTRRSSRNSSLAKDESLATKNTPHGDGTNNMPAKRSGPGVHSPNTIITCIESSV